MEIEYPSIVVLSNQLKAPPLIISTKNLKKFDAFFLLFVRQHPPICETIIYRGTKKVFIEQKIRYSDRGGGPPSEQPNKPILNNEVGRKKEIKFWKKKMKLMPSLT
jgi:hypothetical protein